MKLQQAQELYSEYREGSLSPAMKLALEQYFEGDPEARQDYKSFCVVLDTFEKVELPVYEPPQGFRASLLERAAREDAERRRSLPAILRDWFGGPNLRRLAGVGVAALAVCGIIVGIRQHGGSASPGSMVPDVSAPQSPAPDSTILGVTSRIGDDGDLYHLFRIHLPDSVPSAQVTAEVLADPTEVTDASARAEGATPAFKQPIDVTNDEELQIPVALTAEAPAGTTLDLMVQWQPDDSQLAGGSQVVFTPVDGSTPGASQDVAPASADAFYPTLRYIASNYHVTVICDASAPSTLQVEPWNPTMDPNDALQAAAAAAGYQVRKIDDGTYQLYK